MLMKNFIQKFTLLGLAMFIVLISSSHVSAQRSVAGTVLDSGTGEPLPGVTIVVTGTTTGTITDFSGAVFPYPA